MASIFCSICFELMLSKDILVHLNCGHVFHKVCIEKWFESSKTCPECRKRITKNPIRLYLQFTESDDRINHIDSEIERLIKQNEELKKKHDIKCTYLAKILHRVVDERRIVQNECKTLRQNNARAQDHVKVLFNRVSQLESDVETLKKQLQTTSQEINEELKPKIKRQAEEIGHLERDKDDLNYRVDAFRTEFVKSNAIVLDVRNTNEKLTKELEKYRRFITDVKRKRQTQLTQATGAVEVESFGKVNRKIGDQKESKQEPTNSIRLQLARSRDDNKWYLKSRP